MGHQPGRNDPCWCGSGKKYKHCHRGSDEGQSPAAHLHALDEQVLRGILEYGSTRFPKRLEVVLHGYESLVVGDPDREAHMALMIPWCLYEARFEGRRLVDWYLAERRDSLLDVEAAWFEAQARSWLSAWEITEIEPGKAMHVEDLLTGETRRITEVKGTFLVEPRLAILARVVDHDGFSVMCGCHPNPLRPGNAADAVAAIRKALRIKKPTIPVASLRERDSLAMIGIWQAHVVAARNEPPPELQNTDGDPLDLIEDRFAFVGAGAREAVEKVLSAHEDVDPPDEGEDEPAYTFLRPGNRMHKDWANTIVGRLVIEGSSIRLETNSVKRADALRERVEEMCGASIAFRSRQHKNLAAMLASAAASSPSPPPSREPALDGLAAEWKRKHYSSWPDVPIPALGNRTPREAAASPRLRPKLDVILKEIEHAERSQPPGARYDVRELRADLGL
jgi:SEC-C motif